jgi:hypothetical protein
LPNSQFDSLPLSTVFSRRRMLSLTIGASKRSGSLAKLVHVVNRDRTVRPGKLIISPEDAFQVGEEPEKDSDGARAEDDDGEPSC